MNIVRHHNKNSKKVNEVIQFVKENGGIEYSTKKMQEFKDMALEILSQFPDNDAKFSLIEFVNYTITREK